MKRFSDVVKEDLTYDELNYEELANLYYHGDFDLIKLFNIIGLNEIKNLISEIDNESSID